MSGEILADDNSPMVMTVGQYNDRVAYTWKLAIESEQERIIKLLEAECERPLDPKWEHYRETCSCAQIALIKGEK